MLPRNEDYFSRRLFKFRAKERRINVIDTPKRDAYSLTPFSWNVERLMRRPLKKQRNISVVPYQMLAFCDQLGLKVYDNYAFMERERTSVSIRVMSHLTFHCAKIRMTFT